MGSATYRYTAFLFQLESSIPIPGLRPADSSSTPDIRIDLGQLPAAIRSLDRSSLKLWHASVETDELGRPRRCIWRLPDRRYYLLEYFDGHRFVFDNEATEVWGEWPEGSTLADHLTYLLGPVFGILLELRGITCLHASCVQIGDGCIALVGEPEAGKSTTAAALALGGATLLSDDITTLERQGECIAARPAFPRIRLWPDSAAVLGVALDRLPLLTPTWDKRYLDVQGEGLGFAHEPVQLQAIYVLCERKDESARPYLRQTTPRDGLLALIANVFVNRLPDEGRSARDFPILGEVAARVPVRRVFPHADPGFLPRLCALIEEDLARQTPVNGPQTANV